VVEGITRRRGTRPGKQAAPAVPDVLRLLLAACLPAGTALGARDRAMLLLGFGAALRRSELVALHLGDVAPVPGCGPICWAELGHPVSNGLYAGTEGEDGPPPAGPQCSAPFPRDDGARPARG